MDSNYNILSKNPSNNSDIFNSIMKVLEENNSDLLDYYNDYIDVWQRIIIEYINNSIL